MIAGGAAAGAMASGAIDARDELGERAVGDDHDVSYADYRDEHDSAEATALVANVLYGAGAVAVAAGVALLLLDDEGQTPAAAGPVVGPYRSLGWVWRW